MAPLRCGFFSRSIWILARFGFPYLGTLFDVLGVCVVVAAGQEAEDAQIELVEDLLSIATRFSAKLYGRRVGRKARSAVKAIVAETGAGAVGG